jgi:ribose transport system permease protein
VTENEQLPPAAQAASDIRHDEPAPLGRFHWRDLSTAFVSRYGVLVAFGITFAAFALARPNTFVTGDNFKNILTNAAPQLIVSLGLTVVLVMQDFDLSVGSMVGLADGSAIALQSYHSIGWGWAVVVAIGLGLAGGALNGILIAIFRGNSFIITLAMQFIFTGVEYSFTSNNTIFSGVSPGFGVLGSHTSLGISNQVWFAAGIAAVLWILLDTTETGRYMYAIGGNPEAARLSGIRTRTLRISGFVLAAVCAAVVGLLIGSAGNGYTPSPGQYLLIPSYSGAFLGAAMFRPGEFNVPGTIVGTIYLGMIQTGLTILGLATYLSLIIQGAILIIAVLLSSAVGRRT